MAAQKYPANARLHNLAGKPTPPLRSAAERTASAQAPSASLSAGDSFDLNALLSSAMKHKNDALAVKASRQALAQGNIKDGTARKETEASIRAWEAAREWTTEAHCVMFTRQHCKNCGADHTNFQGFFIRQVSKANKTLNRWVHSEKPVAGSTLPMESKYENTTVPLCNSCGDQMGWELEEE